MRLNSACSSIAPNRRRNQFLFHKRLLILSVLVVISVLTLLSCLKGSGSKNCKSIRTDELYWTQWNVSLEIKFARERAVVENRDEFIEEVLKQTSYFEVNLFESWGNNEIMMPYFRIYDKSIREMEFHVVRELGEVGKEAEVPDWMKEESKAVFKKEAFNKLLAEMISVNRSLPETRETPCRHIEYDVDSLPTLSVIIIYSNEALISIVRTVHSVINRTPTNLLKEVILVDDFSDHLDLQGKLERYLATRFNPLEKIRLLKLSQRTGLIRARMMGAHVAIGDALVFLDAHCEVNVKWAEPLLKRIQEDRKVILSPVIDSINENTLAYATDDSGHFVVGGFSWSGIFYWKEIPNYEKERKQFHYSPTRTAIIAGGLFAVDRHYFWEIGSYDPGMEIWGGENLEISLRVWQCGGSVEIIPCSRVGHIFRAFRPYNSTGEKKDTEWNTARVAEVWMDDYKDQYYLYTPEMKGVDLGDVRSRKAWRRRNNCKSFEWYLSHVYREKFRGTRDSQFYGQVRNPKTDLCLDNMQHEEIGEYTLEVYPCHQVLFPSQLFFLSKKDELRREGVCATFPAVDGGKINGEGMVEIKNDKGNNYVTMTYCEDDDGTKWDSTWEYGRGQDNGRIVHVATGGCLTVKDEGNRTLAVLERCVGNGAEMNEKKLNKRMDQLWEWRNYK